MAESFMRTLKREEVNGQAYRDRAKAESSIEAFIETVGNIIFAKPTMPG